MAPGTVDKRFLTKPAKTASAGGILALAVALLMLAGCGGGSSDDSSSTAATSAAAAGSASAPSSADSGSTPSASAKDADGAGSSGVPSEQPSSGGKHGPPVPQPTGEEAPKITPKQRREATVADMSLQSPSVPPSGALSAEYTCDGKNTSPALRWQGVPQGTAELALFVMNTRPVEGQLFFDWAVAGLSPDLEAIEAGALPKGAVVGRNSSGKRSYEICPPKGEGETYLFTVFALPKKLSPARGFEPFAFRKAVLDISGNVGLLPLTYTRG